MSIGNKYSCGCGKTYSSANYKCCTIPVQPAPEPCCEAHETRYVYSNCLYSNCPVTATELPFFLSFSNDGGHSIPYNGTEVYFYHAVAGLMKILTFNGTAYQVELYDLSRAGSQIMPEDCIIVEAIPAALMNGGLTNRCLVGNFVVPAVSANGTIFISNGGSIPVGSTITFVYEGDVGSYQVIAFVSASGTTYAYTVQNTGNGHVPGTIVEGGSGAICLVPIELITELDFCGNAETNVADSILACVNDTPRQFVPTGENDTIVGTAEGTWTLAKITNLDCCVVIDDCLKFTGQTCPDNSDAVVLRDINLDCFIEALAAAADQEQVLGMNINGFKVVATSFDSGTLIATFEIAEDTNIVTPLSFEEGTQICIGDCCAGCLSGPGSTEVKDPLFGINSPLQSVNGTIDVPAGVSHWLLGLDNTTPQTIQLLELDAAYFAAPGPNGPILPKYNDPMVFRQKVCNNSDKGCYQFTQMQLNYQLAFDPMPAAMIVDWEVAHYAENADTLANGLPNPYVDIATQQKASGRLLGPSVQDALLLNTSFGTGSPADVKIFPNAHGDFRDLFTLIKCDCALSVVWLFVRIDAPAPQLLNFLLRIRRHFQFFDDRRVDMPLNQPQPDGWT